MQTLLFGCLFLIVFGCNEHNASESDSCSSGSNISKDYDLNDSMMSHVLLNLDNVTFQSTKPSGLSWNLIDKTNLQIGEKLYTLKYNADFYLWDVFDTDESKVGEISLYLDSCGRFDKLEIVALETMEIGTMFYDVL